MAQNERRPAHESRNLNLASVALDLFAERGFAAVSIKEIARKADINPALIYYYYKDKADLFRAAISHAVSLAHEHYLQLRLNYDDPMGRIHAWLESNVAVAHRIRNLVKIMLDYSSSAVRIRQVDAAIKEFYELERMILVESIRRGIHDGAFRATDADALAALVSVHLDGVMVASSIRERFDINAAMGRVKSLLNLYLGLVEPARKAVPSRLERSARKARNKTKATRRVRAGQ